MSNVFNKLKDFVGLNEPEYDDDDYYEESEDHHYQPQEAAPSPERERPHRPRSNHQRTHFAGQTQETTPTPTKSNVIGMPGANNGLNEIVVIEPQSFEKMPEVIQALRERKTVLLNLNMMEPDDAQRAVDFVAGGTYAIDGHQERVGESIFLFTPNCVQVTSRSHSTQGVATPQSSNPTNVHQMTPPAGHWHKQQDAIAQ